MNDEVASPCECAVAAIMIKPGCDDGYAAARHRTYWLDCVFFHRRLMRTLGGLLDRFMQTTMAVAESVSLSLPVRYRSAGHSDRVIMSEHYRR